MLEFMLMKPYWKQLCFLIFFVFPIIGLFLPFIQLQAQSNVTNYITDPSLSQRCKELLKDREDKLQLKQKTKALIKRNKDARRRLGDKRPSTMSNLKHNYNKLLQEERLLLLKTQNLEENIIRSGCPGVSI